MKTIFITGTDTEIGKTFVTSLMLQEFNKSGHKTFGIKPIASGCKQNEKFNFENNDALLLQKNSSFYQPYNIVNPIALKDSVAPHLAALNMCLKLTKEVVKKSIIKSIQHTADINLIEGIGGWSVPLNSNELLSEVVAELAIPVILVVGVKLGCLNHAILSYYNILSMRVPFIGWIANCLEPKTLLIDENIETLREWIKQPCLGVIPYNCQDSKFININLIDNYFSSAVSPDENA